MTSYTIVHAGLALLLAWAAAPGQQPLLPETPGSGITRQALRNLPLSPESRAALEKSLDSRDFTGAETILLKEIERHPKSPQLLTFVGGVFFVDGKTLNSAVAMKKAEALAPLDDRSRFTLAMAYVTLNHRDWARPELEKLAASDPRNALYPYWLSRLDYDAQQFGAAVAHARQALELDANFTRAYDNLGLCYEALGRYDDAVRSYQDAVRLNRASPSPSPWPNLNLSALLIKLGRLEEAEKHLRESLQDDPRLAQAHYQMGALLEKQHRDAAALEELKEAAALDASYAEPYYLLGRIYQREGNKKDAETAWNTFARLKKEHPEVRPH
jgi:tetratricopeptide (TPR) repeat protein